MLGNYVRKAAKHVRKHRHKYMAGAKAARTVGRVAKKAVKAHKNVRRRKARRFARKIDHMDSSHMLKAERVSVFLRRPKKLYRTTGTYSYYQQASSSNINAEGQQGVVNIVALCTRDQFLVTPAAGTTDDYYQFSRNIFDLNPYNAWTNTTVYGAIADSATQYTDRVHWKHSTGEIQIINFSNISAELTCYFLLQKMNTTHFSGATAQMGADLTSEGLNRPVATQSTNIAGVITPAVEGAPSGNFYGLSPLTNATFRKQFKVLKKVTFELDGGSVKKLHTKFNINKTYDRKYMVSIPSADNFLAGHTINVMLVWRTQLVHTTAPAAVAVTFGSSRIGWSYNFKHTFTSIGPNRFDVGVAYPNVPAQALSTGANEQFANIVDAVVGVAEA